MLALETDHDDVFVGGEWRPAHSLARLAVTDPATEEVWAHVPDADETDVDAAVRAAHAAFVAPGWSDLPASVRAEALRRLADEFEKRSEALSHTITRENGTPVAETRNAAGHAAGILRYYAGLADRLDADDLRPFPGNPERVTRVLRQPRGVCALIVPWNFPVALAIVKVAPALLAGNTIVLKPAEETPLDLRHLVDAAQAAGIPPGVLNLVSGGRATGAALVAHPLVAKVAFTGSTAAGRAIAETCGRLLRPVTLELGGKSASIVLDDADLDLFASRLNATCLRNTGQTCYNSTRILAPRSRYAELVDRVAAVVAATVQGDPWDPATVYGPSASARQRDVVAGYVELGRREGARVATGGGPSRFERGFYVEPTVFADVDNSMRIAQEEIFGPVLVVVPYDGDDEAVALANDSRFGLGGSIFSDDPEHALAVARRVETGSVGINFYGSNPAAPFGGWKDSGLGLEYGVEGLEAYLRPKSIHTLSGSS